MSRDHRSLEPADLTRHAEALRRMARGLVHDPGLADDLAQDAALAALEGRLRRPADARPAGHGFWRGVLRNLARNQRRGARRRQSHEQAQRPGHAPHRPEEDLARLELHHQLLQQVQALSATTRSAIVLRYYEGLPPREIARRTNTPVETVKARLKRGLDQLRQAMDAEHGGQRKSWLLPVAAIAMPRPHPAPFLATLGGVMKQDLARNLAAATLSVLLLGGMVWGALHLAHGDDARDPGGADLVATADDEAGSEEPGATLTGHDTTTGAQATGADPEGTKATAGAAGAAPTSTAPHTGFVPTPLDAEAFASASPAQIRNPRSVARGWRRAGAKLGPMGGGGPTGHWTRFYGYPPRTGGATLAVLVLDTNQRPLAGATVYLAPPDTLDDPGISFGDLRTLGKTDAAGYLEVPALPAGAGAVLANIHNQLNTPGGLDPSAGQRVLLADGKTARVRVQLPVDGQRFGRVSGRVLDAKGQPITSAAVATNKDRVWSKRDGAFVFEGLPTGTVTLTVAATGRETVRHEVDVTANGDHQVDITLPLADTGSVRLHGVARLPSGTPVPNAPIYLMEPAARGTLRSGRTDATGAFDFEQLPDRLLQSALVVQVSPFPRFQTARVELPRLERDHALDVQIPGGFTEIVLDLRDRSSGQPIRLADVDLRGEQEGGRHSATLSFNRKRERWTGFVEGARGTLEIATLTHGTWKKTIDLLPEGGEQPIEVRLDRVAPDPVEIAIDITLRDAAGGEAIEKAKIEILDAKDRSALARFEGRRQGGIFRVGAPTGTRILRITSTGYQAHEEVLSLTPETLERAVVVSLSAGGSR